MARLVAFPPAAQPDARVLVLGSMPGAASLRAAEYYAHPRNLFWPLMGTLAGAGPDLPYRARIAALNAAGIALWDVLADCERSGSLDSAIRDARRNDFDAFLAAHPRIGTVLFNGAKAEAEFLRGGMPLAARGRGLVLRRLPSTSPANASIPAATRLAAWRDALRNAGIGAPGPGAVTSA